MRHGARIAVIVPAHGEEHLIGRTLEGIPDWVDFVFVVDDASPDRTSEVARSVNDPRVCCLRHRANRGVGAAIVTGYLRALQANADVLAVMAGDNQMDPSDLQRVIAPVARGEADYVKGNRFVHPESQRMPAERRLAGRWLARLTRLATGLQVDDTQCGYTALSARAARRLELDSLWPRFGYPNDLLGMLAAAHLRVVEVGVRPVYADEQSAVRPWHALTVVGVVARRWWLSRRAPEPREANVLDGRQRREPA
jgi:glycosyltransferase involved in cell wall biosynthesis